MFQHISKKAQTLIILLLIISLCVLAMGSIVYLLATNVIKQEAQNAYQVSLLRTKDRIESYFRQIDQSILQFEKLTAFEAWSSPYREEDQLEFLTIRDTMLRMQTSLDYVDNIALYRASTGKLMSTNQPVSEFQDEYRLALQTFVQSGKDFSFLNVSVKTAPTAVFIRKLPVFKSDKTFFIIIHVNQRFFDDILGSDGQSKGNYFILDDKRLLLQNRGALSDDEVASRIVPGLAAEDGAQPEGYFVAHLPPSYMDWTYGFAISNDLLFYKIDRLRNGVFLFTGLLLVVGALGAVLSANRLWRGWSEIVSVLNEPVRTGQSQQGITVGEETANDEFRQIYLKVQSIKDTRNELQEQVKELIPDIREAFIRKILEKGVRTAEDSDKCRRYHIPLEGGPYGCLCVDIDPYKSMSALYSEVDLYYFQYGLSRVILEVIEAKGKGAVSSYGEGRFIGVLTLENGSMQQTKLALLQAAEEIRDFIHSYFPFTVSVGIGRVREDLAYLNLSTQEAEEALKHKLLAGTNQVISIEGLGEPDISGAAVFFKELRNDLLFAIRSRDRTLADAYVEQLATLQGGKSLKAEWLQSQLAELVFSVFRGASESLREPPGEPLMSELLKLSTLEEWVDWIKRCCIEVLMAGICREHLAYMEQVAAQICAHIEEHNEEEIRLETCCKALNLPVSIGKQALKEVHDATFADRLLASRIDKAKRLLTASDSGIEEIASRLLYSNAQNFSRTFKKAVGIPPGQYRKESRE